MVALSRVRVGFEGFPGGPGISTFYFSGGATFLGGLASLYSALKVLIPLDVKVTLPTTGDNIDDVSGDIVGQWIQPEEAPIQCTNAAGYAAPVGGLIKWTTGDIVHSHRVTGKTFVVPLGGDSFTGTGQVSGTAQATLGTAAAAFVAAQAGSFVVWSRPFAGTPAIGTRPANPARSGSSHVVTGSSAPSKAAVLRSRRD